MKLTLTRLIVVFVSLCLILMVTGAAYQNHYQSLDESLAPGELIDIGNGKLHLYCKGHGEPTVIFESGHLFGYKMWLPIIEKISSTTRACSYDRLGLGWSSSLLKPMRANDVAENLHSLLNKAEITTPVILAGWSAGGLYIRKFTEKFPSEVAGLVLIDSSHDQQDNYIPTPEWSKVSYLSGTSICALTSWTGIYRLSGRHSKNIANSNEQENHNEEVSIRNRSGYCLGLLMSSGFGKDVTSNKPPSKLGNTPTIALRRGNKNLEERTPAMADYYRNRWPQLQDELAGLSTNSKSIVAHKSDHGIPMQEPQLVISSILSLTQSFRDNN